MKTWFRLTLSLALLTAMPLNALASGGNAAAGKALYNTQCALCHGNTGKGDGPAGKSLKPSPRNFTLGQFKYGSSDAQIIAFIKKGKAPMPGYAMLKEQQVKDLLAYIRSLKKK